MFNLTKRQEAILYYIIESKDKISIKKIASEYQMSERTIHYDIDYINSWLKQKGGVVKSSKAQGLHFQGGEAAKNTILEDLFQNAAQSHVFLQPERLEYIWNKLLLSGRVVTSEELADELQVSRPTVLADLKKTEQTAAEMNLILEVKKGKGYWIEGKEFVLRNKIAELLIKIFLKRQIQSYDQLYQLLKDKPERELSDLSLALLYLSEIEVGEIIEILNLLRKDDGIFISDTDSFDLFLYISVQVKRLRDGHPVKREDVVLIEKGEEIKRHVLARGICEQLEESYDIHCNKYEISYTCLKLISCNVGLAKTDSGYPAEELEYTVTLMIQVLVDDALVQFSEESLAGLKNDLYEYLSLLLRKKSLHIGTQNPLLAQILAGYPELYQEAERMAMQFKAREGISLTTGEIAAMTIYLAAYADMEKKQRNRAVIVCNEDKGISLLLKNRVKNNLPGLEISSLLSLYELNQTDHLLSDIDFVISTVELPEISLPVFRVNPIISIADIKNISDYMTGAKTIDLVDEDQRKDNYLKNAVISILSKYIDVAQLKPIRRELDYFLSAQSGIVSQENTAVIMEQYSYKTAMVIVKLAGLLRDVKNETGNEVEFETIIGLAIHVIMSITRWEKKDFYLEKGSQPHSQEGKRLCQIAERFLESVSEVFQYPIGKGEVDPIVRYLKEK